MEGLLQFVPTFLVDTIAKILSFEGAFEKAYFFDFIQMLRYGGLRKTDDVHKVVADAIVLFADILQDGDSGRMCHDLRDFGQFIMGCGKNMCFGGAHELSMNENLILQYYDDILK